MRVKREEEERRVIPAYVNGARRLLPCTSPSASAGSWGFACGAALPTVRSVRACAHAAATKPTSARVPTTARGTITFAARPVSAMLPKFSPEKKLCEQQQSARSTREASRSIGEVVQRPAYRKVVLHRRLGRRTLEELVALALDSGRARRPVCSDLQLEGTLLLLRQLLQRLRAVVQRRRA